MPSFSPVDPGASDPQLQQLPLPSSHQPPRHLPRLRAQVEATTLVRLVYEVTAEWPAAEWPAAEWPAAEWPAAEWPAAEWPAAEWPAAERSSLGDQMRRAALSVPANIAEGCARATRADRQRFLIIAWGSLRELEAHVDVATVLGLLPANSTAELTRHCRWTGRLLHGLLQSRMR